MLMLWMCCLSFAQEEKNELGLLHGAEFIPRAATTSNQKLSFGRSVACSVDYARRLSSGNTALLREFPFAAELSHRVESAQLNAVPSLATLFVTPSLRAQFVSHARASPCPILPRSGGRNVAEVPRQELLREIRGNQRRTAEDFSRLTVWGGSFPRHVGRHCFS